MSCCNQLSRAPKKTIFFLLITACFVLISVLTGLQLMIVDTQLVPLDIPEGAFDAIDEENETFPVSAYVETSQKYLRIYLLKKVDSMPLIYCYYVGNTEIDRNEAVSNSRPTLSDHRNYNFHPLVQFTGDYLGYTTQCRLPEELLPRVLIGTVALALHTGLASDVEPIILPIRPGLPLNLSTFEFPLKMGLCLAPFSKLGKITQSFLIQYFELQRAMGVQLVLIYLTGTPSESLRQVLSSYINHPNFDGKVTDSFRLQVVPWNVPFGNDSKTTGYSAQVLSYNDCIFRLARETEFIFHGSIFESFVPEPIAESTRLARWPSVLKVLREEKYANRGVFCFPVRYFTPPGNSTKLIPMFHRSMATTQLDTEHQKCLIRSGKVREVYIHAPVQPKPFTMMAKLGTVHSYGECLESDNTTCGPDTLFAENIDLLPYLNRTQNLVSKRRDYLKQLVE